MQIFYGEVPTFIKELTNYLRERNLLPFEVLNDLSSRIELEEGVPISTQNLYGLKYISLPPCYDDSARVLYIDQSNGYQRYVIYIEIFAGEIIFNENDLRKINRAISEIITLRNNQEMLSWSA